MARIVGGIGSSHTPTIGFALDANKQTDPVWAPIFAGFQPVQKWLREKRPDVLFFIYNDHVTSFFFDHYSHFALGVGGEYALADEGGGPRHLPPVKGHPGLAPHIALALTADEFDLAYFQGKPLDHGCFSPLSMMWPHEGHWPGAIVPLQVGVLEFPIPTARRCFRLGKSLRRAIESYPEDLRVAIVATGGLAHQVHGERAGFNNTPWDMEFLDLLERQPERLSELTIAQYAERGGLEGAEVIMWLIMRGALSARVKRLHSAYYLPSMTPIVTVIYEDDSPVAATETDAEFRERIARELAGVERLPGTYPFTLDRSVKTYRLSHFLHRLIEPQYRRRLRLSRRSDRVQQLAQRAGRLAEDRGAVRSVASHGGADGLGTRRSETAVASHDQQLCQLHAEQGEADGAVQLRRLRDRRRHPLLSRQG